ncbi:MAG: hypothetical protein S4CHLAM20_10920 [Chlamydiia bacterium]|nr:hypothetical protein [Chlamydiia bacterium]
MKKIFLILALVSTLRADFCLTHPMYEPGFFSVFNTVVGALDAYDRSEIDGLQVDFADQGHYYDLDHGPNWWSYYFEPISLGVQGNNKFPTYKKITFSQNTQFRLSRERGFELLQKYVKVKDPIKQKIKEFEEAHFKNNKVLGVHFRGTDKKSEAPEIDYKDLFLMLQQEMEQGEFTKLFIATDDGNFFEYIKKKFPTRICSIPAIRSFNKEAVHLTNTSNYQKGEDALIDCILLSKCDKLYKMASNLSDVSMIWNPYMEVVHLNHAYSERCKNKTFNVFKNLNTVLSLLQTYEVEGCKDGFEVFFPTKQGENWWNVHFKPIVLGKQKTHLQNFNITYLGLNHLFECPVERSNELIEKYIEFQPHILQKADQVTSKLSSKSFIAIYFGSETCSKLFQKEVKQKQVFAEVTSQLKRNESVLWISDDEEFLNEAKLRFPSSVIAKLLNRKAVPFLDYETNLLVNTIALSRARKVIGVGNEILFVAKQLNPNLEVQELSKLWLLKN